MRKLTAELVRHADEMGRADGLKGFDAEEAFQAALRCTSAKDARACFAEASERALINAAIDYDESKPLWDEFIPRYIANTRKYGTTAGFEALADAFFIDRTGHSAGASSKSRTCKKIFLMTDNPELRDVLTLQWSDTARFFAGIIEPQYTWLRAMFAKQIMEEEEERKAHRATA